MEVEGQHPSIAWVLCIGGMVRVDVFCRNYKWIGNQMKPHGNGVFTVTRYSGPLDLEALLQQGGKG